MTCQTAEVGVEKGVKTLLLFSEATKDSILIPLAEDRDWTLEISGLGNLVSQDLISHASISPDSIAKTRDPSEM